VATPTVTAPWREFRWRKNKMGEGWKWNPLSRGERKRVVNITEKKNK
jgi:hypothetical protein